MRCVEIRSYELVPGKRDAFAELCRAQSVPMLERWGVDVVFCGPSIGDANGFVLIRSYDSAEALKQSQEAFYGSAEWRNGPRGPIVALIQGMTNAVVNLEEPTLEALRRDLAARSG